MEARWGEERVKGEWRMCQSGGVFIPGTSLSLLEFLNLFQEHSLDPAGA